MEEITPNCYGIYFRLPIESIATEWAVEFANMHKKEMRQLVRYFRRIKRISRYLKKKEKNFKSFQPLEKEGIKFLLKKERALIIVKSLRRLKTNDAEWIEAVKPERSEGK